MCLCWFHKYFNICAHLKLLSHAQCQQHWQASQAGNSLIKIPLAMSLRTLHFVDSAVAAFAALAAQGIWRGLPGRRTFQ